MDAEGSTQGQQEESVLLGKTSVSPSGKEQNQTVGCCQHFLPPVLIPWRGLLVRHSLVQCLLSGNNIEGALLRTGVGVARQQAA